MNDWIKTARLLGFDVAVPCDPQKLKSEAWVREGCSENRCGAYGKNWTCPPQCGSLQECSEEIHTFTKGILLQTIGHMQKIIDSRCYRETEKRHLSQFQKLVEQVRAVQPHALCLGSGGCRVCKQCSYPDPCRFPEKSFSSMEAYGIFVTQACRDHNLAYYYGEKTITYTSCILF